MLKLLILFILSFSLFTPIIGQVKLSGLIMNEKRKPVESATVLLLQAKDSSLIKSCISDSLGKFFFFNIPPANYILNISSISQRDTLISITISEDYFKTIIVNDKSENLLKNVIVTSKRSVVEIKPDRIIFNPANFISTAGSNAFELLKKAPLVSANENGDISIRGVMGTGVMINGRLLQISGEQIMDYLKSIAAEDVQKIEIITNPSSKYDAQGLAGLVNIITSKRKKIGLNGVASIYGLQNTYSKYGGVIDINYRSGAINVFGGTTLKAGEYYSLEQVDNIYNRNISPYLYYEAGDRNRRKLSNLNKLGIDYTIDKNNVVGIRFEHNYSDNTGTEYNNASFLRSNLSLDSIYKTKIAYKNRNNSYAANVNYQGSLDTLGKSLSVDFDYYTYEQPILSTLTNSERLNSQSQKLGQDIIFRNQLDEKINIYSVKADYSHPVNASSMLEFGAKTYYIKTRNNISFYNSINNTLIIDDLKSNRFQYNESNIAAYTNFNKQFNSKWSTQLGVRIEQTTLTGHALLNTQEVKQNYIRVFPSFFLQYNHSENSQFSLSYTKRINRPGFDNLNPFRYYSTPNSYSEGNPFLQPSISNSMEISFTSHQKFYFNLFASLTKHEITEAPILNAITNSFKYSSVNLDDSYNYGFAAYLPFEIKSWWQTSFSLTAGINGAKLKIDTVKYEYNKFNIQIQSNHQLTISDTRKIYGEINMTYQPSGVTQGLYVLGTYFDCSVGLKKSFKDNRSTLSLNITDIFNKAYVPSKLDRPEQYSLTHGNFDMRGIRLSFSYKFGKNSIPKSRETKSAIDEEKTRIK